MIELKNISFRYQSDEEILSEFNLTLKVGQKVALLGPNGSGKTTIFKMIMGLVKPEQGQVIIFDQLRKTEKDFESVREKVGFLFQEPEDQLFCPSVKEELAFGPLNLGWSKKRVEKKVAQILKKLGIESLENKVPWQLSGGEKKLVALASILTMEPQVLLLDEPFAGLDKKAKDKLINLLQELSQTYILVSHNQQLLNQVTDDIHYLTL